MRSNQTAFTLVEMLVVLVLMGLIISILFQGLSLTGKVNERLVPKLQQQQLTLLQQQWFRETVSGLVAGFSPNEKFAGNNQGFRGLSVNSLAAEVSAPATINWSITSFKSGLELSYRQNSDTQWQIQSFPLDSSPEFSYLSQNGQWLSKWTVSTKNTQAANQLPEAIAFHFKRDQQEHWWIAPIYGEKTVSGWLQNYDE